MKILFCTPTPLTKTLGAPKVLLELAEELQEIGWECEVRGRFDLDKFDLDKFDLSDAADQSPMDDVGYRQRLHCFLQKHAGEYDVVDYDHGHLPCPRTEFAPQTLFVARSVLLAHHFDVISVPGSRSWKSSARRLLCGQGERRASRNRTRMAHRTIQEADLVNVCSEEDKVELVRCGIAGDKIAVLPFGISRSRRPLFDAVPSAVPAQPIVAFVGTFDYRKGAREFPAILRGVAEAVPEARFRLLGTAGLFATEAKVRAHFSAVLQPKLEVIPRYRPEELPSLLAPCSVGIFPSYIEGMPFGVLEMLAASVPVVAYQSPGPPMMLPADFLVPPGEPKQMSRKVVSLLTNEAKLRDARTWAKEQSQHFRWEEVARKTGDLYRKHAEARRGKPHG